MSVEYEFIDILMNVNKFQISRGFADSLEIITSHIIFVDVPLITVVENMRKVREGEVIRGGFLCIYVE